MCSIGEKIKFIRKFFNMNQIEFSKAINLSQSRLSEIEKGTNNPAFTTLQSLQKTFNISIDKLIDNNYPISDKLFIGSSDVSQNTIYTITDKISKLSKHGQSTVNDFVEFLIYREEVKTEKQSDVFSILKVAEKPAVYKEEVYTAQPEASTVYIPMLGYIAAGQPINLPDDYTFDDVVAMPCTEEAEQADFALQIKGDSMYPLIEDGETILVKRQSTARDGQIVVASINNATTLKKFYQFPDRVELHAINIKYDPIIINNEYTDFKILGVKL